jgi:hypothetical protein
MAKGQRVHWGVPEFPKAIKDEFIWICKVEGKDYKKVLENLVKGFNHDHGKEIQRARG